MSGAGTRRRETAWLLLGALAALPLRAEPTIEGARPLAVCPGRAVRVTFSGKDLRDDLELWTSFPARSALEDSGSDRSSATFLVTAGEDVQIGVGAVRLVSPRGASNPFLLMVDDLPGATPSGGGAEARELSLPAAVDGECVPDRWQSFSFAVRAGQRWTFDVVAQRLGSALDPVLRLLDPEGRELVHCDDSGGLGADCRFAHTFASDGRHRVELRSVDYRGGPAHRYRLRIGEFPAAAAVFPMGTQSGRETDFVVREGSDSETFSHTPGRPDEHARLSLPGRRGSGFVPLEVVASGEPGEFVEGEDVSDGDETQTRLSIPRTLNGRFDRPGDRDAFRLEIGEAQRIVFEGLTRRLGSRAELYLELRRANGEVLARSDGEESDEGFLDHTFKEAGEYILSVEELTQQGGDGFFYRLEARPYRPSFRLTVETDRVKVERGGEFKLKVGCERRGHDGSIDLDLAGDIGELRVLSGKIAAGKNSGEIRLGVPEGAVPGRLYLPGIVGRARAGKLVVRASAAPALQKLFPRLREYPELLEYRLAVVVSE